MSLQVFTGRLWIVDPDVFNVTRGSGGAHGSPFAPSQPLLTRYLGQRADAQRRASKELVMSESLDAWIAYREDFLAEMRESYVRERSAWLALLARERVVLTCYCPDVDRCHRGLLAGILAKLGAKRGGELQMAPRRRST